MDDELNALEAELSRLRPVGPSAHLLSALERKLERQRSRSAWRICWVALPIAAAVAVVLLPGLREVSPVASSAGTSVSAAALPAFKPVAAQNLLLGEREEDLLVLSDGSPARRVRQTYLDRITWENPSTHASLTWTVPREEVSVVPVSYQ